MNKNLRIFTAVLVCLSMLLGMSATVFAVDGTALSNGAERGVKGSFQTDDKGNIYWIPADQDPADIMYPEYPINITDLSQFNNGTTEEPEYPTNGPEANQEPGKTEDPGTIEEPEYPTNGPEADQGNQEPFTQRPDAEENPGIEKKPVDEDQSYALSNPAPRTLEQLKQEVNLKDPRSVCSYWIWAVHMLTENYNQGMAMMKYLFADLEVYGKGYTEGGLSGRAGFDTYFDERTRDIDYRWITASYLVGATKENGLQYDVPVKIDIHYDKENTESANDAPSVALGRTHIYYWVPTSLGQNRVSVRLTKFEGTGRWYVTSGSSSAAQFYNLSGALNASELELARENAKSIDTESAGGEINPGIKPIAEGGELPDEPIDYNDPNNWGTYDYSPTDAKWSNTEIPFQDVPDECYYRSAVAWAYNTKPQITDGKSKTKFGSNDTCTRGQVVTFLWRAAGEPEPKSLVNPFKDVKESDYFFKPVLWAVELGITQGANKDGTLFLPERNCDTMEIITFIYRSVFPGADGYGDEARTWAYQNAFPSDTDLYIKIKEDCPRSAVVTFLYRYFKEN
jgi:hypothetical protein